MRPALAWRGVFQLCEARRSPSILGMAGRVQPGVAGRSEASHDPAWLGLAGLCRHGPARRGVALPGASSQRSGRRGCWLSAVGFGIALFGKAGEVRDGKFLPVRAWQGRLGSTTQIKALRGRLRRRSARQGWLRHGTAGASAFGSSRRRSARLVGAKRGKAQRGRHGCVRAGQLWLRQAGFVPARQVEAKSGVARQARLVRVALVGVLAGSGIAGLVGSRQARLGRARHIRARSGVSWQRRVRCRPIGQGRLGLARCGEAASRKVRPWCGQAGVARHGQRQSEFGVAWRVRSWPVYARLRPSRQAGPRMARWGPSRLGIAGSGTARSGYALARPSNEIGLARGLVAPAR